MTTKTVVLNDFAKELENFTEERLEDYQRATVEGVAKSIPTLVQNSPVDTGLYAQSWDFTADEKRVILGNTAPHAPIIERGARPFTPPIAPLLAWAKRVLKDSSQPPDYSNQVWALARGVQQKIAREGIKPRKVLERSLPAIIENIRREMQKIGS